MCWIHNTCCCIVPNWHCLYLVLFFISKWHSLSGSQMVRWCNCHSTKSELMTATVYSGLQNDSMKWYLRLSATAAKKKKVIFSIGGRHYFKKLLHTVLLTSSQNIGVLLWFFFANSRERPRIVCEITSTDRLTSYYKLLNLFLFHITCVSYKKRYTAFGNWLTIIPTFVMHQPYLASS